MVLSWEIVDRVQLVAGVGTQISVLKITCKKVSLLTVVKKREQPAYPKCST